MKIKAQSEIMGLGVLVVLIVVIMMVYLSMSMNKPQEEPKKEFDARQMSVNFLSAYKRSSLQCGFNIINIEDLISECAANNVNFNCNGKTACEQLNISTSKIINISLNKLGKKYYLGFQNIDLNFSKDCTPEDFGSSSRDYVRSKYSPLELVLRICS